jgi:hypothetical protein
MEVSALTKRRRFEIVCCCCDLEGVFSWEGQSKTKGIVKGKREGSQDGGTVDICEFVNFLLTC